MAFPFGRPGQGLFRNVIRPWDKRTFGGAMGSVRASATRGYGYLKSNAGFGFSALKGDPKTVMGHGQLQALGRQGRALRPWNLHTLGPQMGHGVGRWGSAGELAGQGKLRGLAIGARVAAPGAAVLGATAGLDFLNPWGLGWGD